jgi:hypothetical protein
MPGLRQPGVSIAAMTSQLGFLTDMNTSIQRQRFWFGTAMVIVPCAFLLLAITPPRLEENRSGPIEGHVSFHGRPLAGGFIAFIPIDPTGGNWRDGAIDENGHFLIGSGWYRGALEDKVGFRIWIKPGSDSGPGEVPHALDRARSEEPLSPAKAPDCPTADAASDAPRRSSDLESTRLEVQLDSAPAHVDIAL